MGDALRTALADGLPDELLSPDGLARMERVADQLPGRLTSTFGFEVELGEPAAGADFAVAVTKLHGGREILLETGKSPPAPGFAWAALARLTSAWSVPGSALDAELHNLALEFDLDGADTLPAPNVFLGAKSGILPPPPSHPRQLELPAVGSAAWLLDTALPLLGRPVTPRLRDSLSRCFEALPAGARAFQVGVMLARPVEAFRVCVLGLPRSEVTGLLERAGWPGDADQLQRTLAPVTARAETVVVDLDVGEELLPSLGLECFVAEDGGPDQQARWARFLDPLERARLCRPERRQALLDWPRVVRESEAGSWPRHLREASEFVGADVEGSFVRALNHVKLSWTPSCLKAKAYLRLQHRWRPSRPPDSSTNR